MTRLSIFQQEILDVLEQLERCCDGYALHNKNKITKVDTIIDIMVTDIMPTPIFKEITRIYDISKYLQDNGLDFSITFDFINDSPLAFLNENHPTYDFIKIGTIKGKSVRKIKAKIENLIQEIGVGSKVVNEPPIDSNLTAGYDQEEEDRIRISKLVYKKYKDIDLKIKDGRGLLQFHKGKKRIDVGSTKTRTYRMVKYILDISSKSDKVVDIFELIKKPGDDNDKVLQKDTSQSYFKKRDIILSTVKELQKTKFLAGYMASPIFDDIEKTAVITFK